MLIDNEQIISSQDHLAAFTDRQQKVAHFLAYGFSKKEIANYLDISERTVENHARFIYEKAEVNCIGQLCAWWFSNMYNIPETDRPDITPKVRFDIGMLWNYLELN